ncbi:alpha-1,6-mannosyltransferase [Couchioplanes caeruleus]|uniref:DUF2029 domain-containing protein n=2 Tax=Couchioplanes caeruleus TaxID=56438 RepID=A0A1K0FI40_9ACTN|nr:DUF2029 domain-containing protein [Couchioplanes caeruleus subsp. caeruleus]ROP32134.1 alpha-1,6-mannosyltransferase [Couchioplanes caeruleus]
MVVTSRFLRYLGLAGSVLLAVAGCLGGALPAADLAATPVSIARGPYGPAILGLWLAGTALQAYAWWAGRACIPSARWALTTALVWMVPFLLVPPVGSRDIYSYMCQGEMYLHGVDPYTNGVGALPCTWLETVSPVWRDTATPYGPLFIVIAAAAISVGGSLTGALIVFRLITLAAILAIAAGLPALARRCGVEPRLALWVGLAGPLIGAHLLGAPHNDAIMLGLAVVALLLIVRMSSHPVALLAAGALLGLAVAVKATAVVIVPFAVLAASRPLWRAAASVGGSALAVLTAVTVTSGLGFGWIPAMRGGSSLIQFTSPPTAIGMTLTYIGRLFDPGFDAVPAVRTLALALLAAVLVALWWWAYRSPDPARAALRGAALALVAFVALAPVFHPWYALWPLTLLAATTTRVRAVMLISVAAAFSVLPDGSGLTRFVKFPGAPIVTLLLVVLLVTVVRRSGERGSPGSSPGPVASPHRSAGR